MPQMMMSVMWRRLRRVPKMQKDLQKMDLAALEKNNNLPIKRKGVSSED